jgi:hypothetical protein
MVLMKIQTKATTKKVLTEKVRRAKLQQRKKVKAIKTKQRVQRFTSNVTRVLEK